MKSPAEMRIILIDITNACIHQCSNCTRYCGHHKKPFFMDYETFCRAVDSMDGFPGTVGMIGGEPTLHPDFERMAKYLGEKRGPKTDFSLYRPQQYFMDAVHDTEMAHTYISKEGENEKRLVCGGGVWSVMGEGYKKHYEVIQDIAKYQALNDHSNPMYHKPSLISRKELGIPDDEWFEIRDNCWVVEDWSANITPKGAFFCEVAGCLDLLFDGPGGIPIEPGWWKKRPEEFDNQLEWCEICGMALETFTRDANDEIDDVSPELYERLKAIGSRKVSSGKVNVVNITDGVIDEESKAKGKSFDSDMPYVEHYMDRFVADKSSLYYKEYVGVYICNTEEELSECMDALGQYKAVYVLLDESLMSSSIIEKADDDKVKLYDNSKYNLGYVMWEALRYANQDTYALCISGNVHIKGLFKRLSAQVLNPGVLFYSDFDENVTNEYFDAAKGSKVMLLNGIAHSVREFGWDNLLRIKSFEEVKEFWQAAKLLAFTPESEGKVPISEIIPNKRYALYGAGRKAGEAIDFVKEKGSTVELIVDPNEILQERLVCGYTVKPPEYLADNRDAYDKVLMVVGPFYMDAKNYLLSIGVKAEDMAWM